MSSSVIFKDEQADEPDRLPTVGYSNRPWRDLMPVAFGGDGCQDSG